MAWRLLSIADAAAAAAAGQRRPQAVRLPLYGALLHVLALAGGGAAPGLSPAAVAALLDGAAARPPPLTPTHRTHARTLAGMKTLTACRSTGREYCDSCFQVLEGSSSVQHLDSTTRNADFFESPVI